MRDMISLAEAVRLVREHTGRKYDRTTIYRWITEGLIAADGERVRLAHRRVGRLLYTTVADLEAFFNQLTERDLARFECAA